jgi:hypothetical protein
MERGCFLQVYSKSNRELIADSLVPLRFFWFHGSHGNLLYLTGNGGAATPGFIRIYTLDLECFKKL